MDWILVVEDESSFRSFLCAVLRKEGYSVEEARDGLEALEHLAQRRYAVVLTDLRMPGLDGMEVLHHVQREAPDTSVVVLTAYGTISSAVEAMKQGAADYLTKPLENPEQLRIIVRRLLEQQRREAENTVLKGPPQSFPGFVHKSLAMQRIVGMIHALRDNNTTVLLTGESGVGKEVVARAIHLIRHPSEGPFVAVNCAAMPDSLLENELFGHERGAFTGANERLRGKFELAHGGTLFLDEIGEMPVTLQAKLLRVLEEKEFERVGGTARIRVDVCIIAATNRDLALHCQLGNFRKDLFYRLMVFPIALPPLRERKEDILPLVRYFLVECAKQLGRKPLQLTEEVEALLLEYAWPGNIRELRNALERATILGRDQLSADLLGLEHALLPMISPSNSNLQHVVQVSAGNNNLPTLKELERVAIEDALRNAGGDRKTAAQLLGISLRTLQYRIREYGLKGT
jgi:DNA-binding NtrC family response regulator